MTDQTGRTAAPAAKKKKGLSRKTLYMLIALAAAALMMSLAAVIRGANDGREYALYYDQAVSAYDCGDYNTALSYLRKAYAKSETDECVVFMADCYEAQKNYTKALELLTALNSRKSDILSRIAALEEKCGRSEDAGRVTVAGKEYPVNTTGIVLDNMALGDGVLSELSSLYALSNLSAAGNGITSIAPISQLGGLTTLNLSDNSISDISPLSSLSNLRTLYLDNNPVADLSPLCSLSNLTTLSIKGVPVTDRQLAELSSALPNCAIHSETASKSSADITLGGVTFKSDVTELDLSGLGIRDISALSECRSLARLDLSGNSISDLSPLMDIPGLMWLNVASNNISDLSPIMGITAISALDARDNFIRSTAPLSMLTGLTELHLENNPLTSLSGLRRLRALETLGLGSTGLTDGELSELYDLGSLRLLNIKGNPALSGDAVHELKDRLPYCAVTHDELSFPVTIGGEEFPTDSEYVDVTGKSVTSIDGIEQLIMLETAYLGNNYISDVSPLQNLTNLRSIDLSNNMVYDISPLWNLTRLEYLNLAGNGIESVRALMGMTRLRHLDLTGNPLSQEQIDELQSALPDCQIYF